MSEQNAGPAPMPRKLNAYYYSFDPTGVDVIDAVLEAVARAGKSYHHTEDWNTKNENGESPVWRIQCAAIDASRAMIALSAQVEQLTAELAAVSRPTQAMSARVE